MMIRPTELAAIRAGTIDLGFRRWGRPRVLVGTRMRTAVGVIEVTSVDQVDEHDITEDDARRAGAASLASLRRDLEAKADRPVFRVGLRYAGEDPRVKLRRTVPTEEEIAQIRSRLARLDTVSPIGPWTLQTLELIDRRPTVRAPDLAAELGRDTPDLKRDVRKLKELGLTESLDIGYRISPRGIAVLDADGVRRTREPAPQGTSWPRIGAPATRALRAAGYTTLESLDGASESALAALHGVGPIALERLRSALQGAGLVVAP